MDRSAAVPAFIDFNFKLEPFVLGVVIWYNTVKGRKIREIQYRNPVICYRIENSPVFFLNI
jgi:hypothetical protein